MTQTVQLPPEVQSALSEMGIEIPTDPVAAIAVLTSLQKLLGAAKKSMPKKPALYFQVEESGETLLRVKRGGRGQPLLLTQEAAKALLAEEAALRHFAEHGSAPEGAHVEARAARATSASSEEEE